MSSSNTLSKPAAIRRTRFAIQTIALVFAVTACCAFAAILGDRFPRRFDATATREHHLSPRTEILLNSLTGDYELVVAANFSTLDPAAARRTQDVLDNFSRTSPHIHTTVIDVSSSRGLSDLDALLARLVERFRPDLERQRDGLDRAAKSTEAHAESLTQLSNRLLAIRDTVKETDPSGPGLNRLFTDLAARCRVVAEDLSRTRTAIKDAATRTIGGGRTPLPATDEAVATLRKPISDALELVGRIGDTFDAIARSTDDKLLSPELCSQARAPAAEANALRAPIGQTLAGIDDLPRTPLGAVLRVLERTSAAIVIAPPGQKSGSSRAAVASVELSAIFPPRMQGDQDGLRLDLRARTEELLAGAIASLARDDSPIVVFVHGREVRIAPDFRPVLPIVERFRLRGIDVAEWPTGLDSDPPSLKSLDPQGKRTAVYVVLSMGANSSEDAARFGKLVQATKRLLEDGKRVLICEVPSTMQALAQKDPMAEILVPLGIKLDSGRPLLHQATGPRGRVVTPDTLVTDPRTDHPIARAVRGLAVYLPWSVPVGIAEVAKGVEPVVLIDAGSRNVWAESEWLSFSQTPSDQQALLVNPPAPNTSTDDPFGCWPNAQPSGWPVVVATERSGAAGKQRVVVVGSNKWIAGEVIGAETEVEGRRVPTYPGNMELLDACVYWLAGQDAMISSSATARDVPRIPALSDGVLGALRWALIGGLPILILLIGAVWRLVRG